MNNCSRKIFNLVYAAAHTTGSNKKVAWRLNGFAYANVVMTIFHMFQIYLSI